MVVEFIETNATKEIRKLVCLPKESDLSFLTGAKLLFETMTLLASKLDCISTIIGKLSSHTRNRILHGNSVDNLSFENLVASFRKEEE